MSDYATSPHVAWTYQLTRAPSLIDFLCLRDLRTSDSLTDWPFDAKAIHISMPLEYHSLGYRVTEVCASAYSHNSIHSTDYLFSTSYISRFFFLFNQAALFICQDFYVRSPELLKCDLSYNILLFLLIFRHILLLITRPS